MKFIIGISMMVCLLMVAWCSKEKPVAPAYFDCEYYNYFPNDTFPVITTQDSLAARILAQKLYISIDRDQENLKGNLLYLMPYIHNKIDTAIFNKYVLRQERHSLKPIFNSLTSNNILLFIFADAIIKGRLVDSRSNTDTNLCYYFKTYEIIQCDEVLYSNFELKKNDFIMTASIDGIVGGCIPGGSNIVSWSTHKRYLKKGKEEFIVLSRNIYRGVFLKESFQKGMYQDEFCANALYRVNMYEEDFQIEDVEKIKDIEKFIAKMKHKK